MFALPENRYTVTEQDPERLWIVRGISHGAVTLADDASFFEWAAENWPAPKWSVELDPYQLARWLR
jgi:dTDP-4-dehydrorhamnose 3,5-epimerase-like enzyme